MPHRVEYLGFPTYTHAKYTFRRGVQKPDSWIRRVHRELKEWGTFTKLELFQRCVPHVIQDGKVTPGWGTSVWSALQKVGIMEKTPYRRKGYPVMTHGPNFKELDNVIRWFELHGPQDWETINELRSPDSTEMFDGIEQWMDFQDFFERNVTHWRYEYQVGDVQYWEPYPTR